MKIEQDITKPALKKCFSYIRFSSVEQSKSTSEKRQLEIAPRVAAEKGWQLDEKLNVSSLGISGYDGSNVDTIRRIVKAANEGKIITGTVCILEALDRLTRLNVDDAYQLLRDILKSGIEIYNDRSNRHLTKADLTNPMSIMMTVVELDAGFQYSDKLAERVRKAWILRANNPNKTRLTKNGQLNKAVPTWIDATDYSVIKEKSKVVQRMFRMFLNGDGITQIARTFNSENVPTFRKGKFWNSAYIGTVLQNISVIGEFQMKTVKDKKKISIGDTIKNYYPPIIKEEVFYAAQEKWRRDFKHAVRNTGKVANIFAGAAYCTCGERMNKMNGKIKSFMACKAKYSGLKKCTQPLMSYDAYEQAFLEFIHMDPELFAFNKAEMVNEASVIGGKIAAIQKQIDNITEAILSGMATKALTVKQAQLEAQLEDMQANLNIANSKSQNGEFNSFDYDRVMNNLSNFKTDFDLRKIVRDFILSNCKSIIFDNKHKNFTISANNGRVLKVQIADNLKMAQINDGKPYLIG